VRSTWRCAFVNIDPLQAEPGYGPLEAAAASFSSNIPSPRLPANREVTRRPRRRRRSSEELVGFFSVGLDLVRLGFLVGLVTDSPRLSCGEFFFFFTFSPPNFAKIYGPKKCKIIYLASRGKVVAGTHRLLLPWATAVGIRSVFKKL
jgi:hypothetical protein